MSDGCGEVSMQYDGPEHLLGVSAFWVEVNLPDSIVPTRHGTSAMFYVYAPDHAAAVEQLRLLGSVLTQAAITDGMLSSQRREAWAQAANKGGDPF